MNNCTDCGTATDSPWYQWTEGDDKEPLCCACADTRHLADLREHGRGVLYDCDTFLSWTGTVKLQPWSHYGCSQTPESRKSARTQHNVASWRYDTWFRVSGDPFIWNGVRFGDMTQILHVRRTKRQKWSDS